MCNQRLVNKKPCYEMDLFRVLKWIYFNTDISLNEIPLSQEVADEWNDMVQENLDIENETYGMSERELHELGYW